MAADADLHYGVGQDLTTGSPANFRMRRKPRLALSRLRVKTPKRTIVPLSVDEVARFWSSFSALPLAPVSSGR